jgi:hypothetical protein
MYSPTQPGEYRPILLSRRGEWLAWSSTVLIVIAWVVLYIRGSQVGFAVPLLTIILLLSAMSISLGNWMDRRTVIYLDETGVSYQNGLRNVKMAWQDLREVRVIPARWGKMVQVIGTQAYFAYQTLAELKVLDEVKGRMGFVEGDEILRQILLSSGLQIVERPGEGYYYARE